ncbi:MAG: hypothetical protein ABH950_07670 [Candidatus Altiarchaeota archaeon]
MSLRRAWRLSSWSQVTIVVVLMSTVVKVLVLLIFVFMTEGMRSHADSSLYRRKGSGPSPVEGCVGKVS